MKFPIWFIRAKARFFSLFRKREIEFIKEKKKKIPEHCQYIDCKTSFTLINYFYCKYCNKFHCEKHRLPEKHKCSNPKNPHIQYTKESLRFK